MGILDSLPPNAFLPQIRDLTWAEQLEQVKVVLAKAPKVADVEIARQGENRAQLQQQLQQDPMRCTLALMHLQVPPDDQLPLIDRVVSALADHGEWDETIYGEINCRYSYRCPNGCGARIVVEGYRVMRGTQDSDGNLVMQDSDESVMVHCTGGCSIEQLTPIITELIVNNEAEASANRARLSSEHFRLNVSLARRLGSLPALDWTIPKIVSSDALTLLVGESGDGKTFFAMCLAIGLAAGVPVFGQPVKQTRVLLVLLEGSEADWGRRIHQLAIGMGTTFDALDGWLDIYDQRPSADDPNSYVRLADYARARHHKLIVIDNLTEIRSGTSQNAENSADVMSAAMRPLAKLSHDEHVSILLLHHAGANGNLRGSTAIRQMCDEELRIKKSSDRNDAIVTISRGKSRRGDGVDRIRYRMIDKNDADGNRTMITPRLVGKQDEEIDDDELDEVIDQPTEAKPLRTKLLSLLPTNTRTLCKGMGVRSTTTITLRDAMANEGVIECRDGVWYAK